MKLIISNFFSVAGNLISPSLAINVTEKFNKSEKFFVVKAVAMCGVLLISSESVNTACDLFDWPLIIYQSFISFK